MPKFDVEVDHPDDCSCRLCSQFRRQGSKKLHYTTTTSLMVRIPTHLYQFAENHPEGKKELITRLLREEQQKAYAASLDDL